MVPFTLRVLKAELDYLMKTNLSMDPLYELLSLCRKEIANLKINQKKIERVFTPLSVLESLTAIPLSPTPSFNPTSSFVVEDIFHGTFEGK